MNYKVYQGNELKQTVTSKTAVINGLQPNKTYDFSVQPNGTQTVGGRTRYTHVAYANSSDTERNMNNWVLSDHAEQAAKITYKDGINTIDYKGVTSWEVFNVPIKAKKGQSFTFSFSWTQPDVKSLDGTANGAPVSISDAPITTNQVGRNVINLGVSKMNSKVFTISGTATADETYVSINLGYLADGIQWQFKASFQQDFSQASDNHEYVGWYSDFSATDSNDPSQYIWRPVQEGTPKETISVTTRGIRFNIPKTLMVGSTITLRYEEYPLGVVPIGNEPSGYFGGGNKQNLSAKVISTENGSSVVEVAGNVIEVGGDNLIVKSKLTTGYLNIDSGSVIAAGSDFHLDPYIATNGETVFTFSSPDYVFKGSSKDTLTMYDSDKNYLGYQRITSPTQTLSKHNASYIRFSMNFVEEGGTYDHLSDWLDNHRYKLEQGDIATPYASFVDGDTFTAQPDGTYALFSEYKALYY